MEMAVAYAKDRKQFDRPIGAYQAVSHQCAEMLYDVEEARSLTYYAAWAADAEPESLPLAAAMAKSRASDAAWEVCKSSIQVHGGIGFTWEHDLHFLLKRARVGGQLFGTASEHRERVAGARRPRLGGPLRYWSRTLIGAGLFIGSLVLFNVKLTELLDTGTCASGNQPYEIARPCPEGTGTDMLLLTGSIFGVLIGGGILLLRGAAPGGRRPGSRPACCSGRWASPSPVRSPSSTRSPPT